MVKNICITLTILFNLLFYNTSTASTFPQVSAPSLVEDGLLLNVNKLNAPVVLVNFWASWCGICKSEMNDIFKVVEHYKGDVQLVTISTDDHKADAMNAYNEFKDKYALALNEDIYWLWDETKDISVKLLNILRVPETYFLIKKGNEYKVFHKVVGRYKWQGRASYKEIDKVLMAKKRGE